MLLNKENDYVSPSKGRFTRYDFVVCDKLTTSLRHDVAPFTRARLFTYDIMNIASDLRKKWQTCESCCLLLWVFCARDGERGEGKETSYGCFRLCFVGKCALEMDPQRSNLIAFVGRIELAPH